MKIDKKKLNFIMKSLKKRCQIEYYRDAFTREELEYLRSLGVEFYYSTSEMPHLLSEGYYTVETIVLELA